MFSTLLEAFPDLRMSVDSIGAEGDRVWVRTTMQGTQQGPFMGMPPSGKTFAVTTVNEVRVEIGKVAEEWGVTDTLTMWQQLGLMPQATS
jgi:predicted ester cyclase